MSIEPILGSIQAKLDALSGLPPDVTEEFDALREEFAKKAKPAPTPKAEAKPAAKKPAAKK